MWYVILKANHNLKTVSYKTLFIVGINVSQLSHYSSGLKKPRQHQREKIISGLHKIGNDLLALS